MGALEHYLKKNKKSEPYSGKKGGKWKGPEGVKKKDQYAKKSGKKINDDEKEFAESEEKGKRGVASIKSGGQKSKQRTYLDV